MGRTPELQRLVGMGNGLLTAGQVARMLGVPKSWVYEQSRRGRIPTVTLGRYRRYRAEAIAEWVERLESGRDHHEGEPGRTSRAGAQPGGGRR